MKFQLLPTPRSRGIHGMLNSGVTGFCLDSKLRKSSEDHFFYFGHHEGELETLAKICVAVSLETLHEIPPYAHCKSP